MLNVIAKWYISRAIDCNRPLPGWVARRVDSNEELSQFLRRSQRLASQLTAKDAHHTAVARAANMPDTVSEVSQASRAQQGAQAIQTFASRRSVSFGLTLAAAITLCIFAWRYQPQPSEPTAKLNEPTKTLTETQTNSVADSSTRSLAKPTDATKDIQLVTLISAGKEVADQWSSRAAASASESTAYIALINAAVALDQDSTDSSSLLAEQVVAPVHQVGQRYGALLGSLDDRLEMENRQLLESGKAAWKYFTRKLPERAASLAGVRVN